MDTRASISVVPEDLVRNHEVCGRVRILDANGGRKLRNKVRAEISIAGMEFDTEVALAPMKVL